MRSGGGRGGRGGGAPQEPDGGFFLPACTVRTPAPSSSSSEVEGVVTSRPSSGSYICSRAYSTMSATVPLYTLYLPSRVACLRPAFHQPRDACIPTTNTARGRPLGHSHSPRRSPAAGGAAAAVRRGGAERPRPGPWWPLRSVGGAIRCDARRGSLGVARQSWPPIGPTETDLSLFARRYAQVYDATLQCTASTAASKS